MCYDVGMEITDAQHRVLDEIIRFKTANDGTAPSVRELAAAAGLASTNTVQTHLVRLEAMGYIERDPCLARVIRVTGGRWLPPKEDAA